MKNVKPTLVSYCGECQREFTLNETVYYTWYENRCYCGDCRDIMNTRVTPSYLAWEIRRYNREEALSYDA